MNYYVGDWVRLHATMYNVYSSNECGSSPKSVRPLSHLFAFLFFFLWIRLCIFICHFRSNSYSLILEEQSSVLSVYFEIFFVCELLVVLFFLLCTIDDVRIQSKNAPNSFIPLHIYILWVRLYWLTLQQAGCVICLVAMPHCQLRIQMWIYADFKSNECCISGILSNWFSNECSVTQSGHFMSQLDTFK